MTTDAFYVTFTAAGEAYDRTNSISDFLAPTPWTKQLRGRWECALVDIALEWPGSVERVYVCCQAVQDSYVNAARVQQLRNVEWTGEQTVKATYLDPRYVSLVPGELEFWRFYLLDQSLKPVTSNSQKLHCVLRVRPKDV